MRRYVVALAAIAALAAAFTVAFGGSAKKTASPAQVAGLYVKSLAHNAQVRIVGDKVWSVRTHGYITVAVVRVRYRAVDGISAAGLVYGPPQVTTIFVREIRSNYIVAG